MIRFVRSSGDFTVDAGPIQWINIWIEDNMVKMPNHDREAGQDGFVKVNRECDVQRPTGKEFCDIELEPEGKARDASHGL